MKTMLILVDGMRPDALIRVEKAQTVLAEADYTLEARTVFPSVTLPCHVSLFHSVDPSRHGTTTNTYTPQVRPINGLCEVLLAGKKSSAFFYDWEELRDIARPNSLTFSTFCKGGKFGFIKADDMLTDAALDHLNQYNADFIFFYQGAPDSAGHHHGWMSEEYMGALENSWKNIVRVLGCLPEDYTVIITADHGGHERHHGSDLPEDMTIPILVLQQGKEKRRLDLSKASIKDIAPTVVDLMGLEPDEEWEGKSLLR